MLFAGGVTVVLGAGASKGASLPGKTTPPLDVELLAYAFDRFTRIRARGVNRSAKQAWKSFCEELKKTGLKPNEVKDWRLEQLSTFLEARANLRGLQLYRGKPKNFKKALEELERVIAYTLWACGGDRVCPIHRSLFQATRPNAVVSFNYDLIADQTLLDLKWLHLDDKLYRGALTAMVPSASSGSLYARKISPPDVDRRVPLYKLHGSIHFGRRGRGKDFGLNGVSLPSESESLFTYRQVPKRPLIIPPVAAKMDIPSSSFKERWEEALDRLHETRHWIIWGYSFPTTDTISHVLFKSALANNRKKKNVYVINPDHTVAHRIERSLKKVNVRSFVSAEKFLFEHKALVQRYD
ncbi:MAG TPA: SIR2 family protein [Pseudobdellovibrionaceae bacterium]|nr:SIR2 family protein [Pseudobdellovibrionaceae bacterium]